MLMRWTLGVDATEQIDTVGVLAEGVQCWYWSVLFKVFRTA